MNFNINNFLLGLKHTAGGNGPQMGLLVIGFDGYFLRPIPTRAGQLNERDIHDLTIWRNKHPKSFLTEFTATENKTSKWLTNICYNDDTRISFMVVDKFNQSVGYMGIAFIDWDKSYVEADSIVGREGNPKGLMSEALKTLLFWSKEQLGLKNVCVRVLSDNSAIAFYKKIGFVETKRVPLKMISDVECCRWIEDSSNINSERQLVHFAWKP
jgi:RimJ/RimL family protein N-acetyltransferase